LYKSENEPHVYTVHRPNAKSSQSDDFGVTDGIPFLDGYEAILCSGFDSLVYADSIFHQDCHVASGPGAGYDGLANQFRTWATCFLTFQPDVEYAKDTPAAGVATDLNGGLAVKAYEAIYGKAGFSEWIPNLTEERLIELLTTGKPTTVNLFPKDVLGSMAKPEYDDQ
jgi:hypothetical protein